MTLISVGRLKLTMLCKHEVNVSTFSYFNVIDSSFGMQEESDSFFGDQKVTDSVFW